MVKPWQECIRLFQGMQLGLYPGGEGEGGGYKGSEKMLPLFLFSTSFILAAIQKLSGKQ
jgi:hypothetical protein